MALPITVFFVVREVGAESCVVEEVVQSRQSGIPRGVARQMESRYIASTARV